jgi:hypothetical protein
VVLGADTRRKLFSVSYFPLSAIGAIVSMIREVSITTSLEISGMARHTSMNRMAALAGHTAADIKIE